MIKERYCSYEVAKLLKEKGFDEECHHIYVGVTLEWTNTIYGDDVISNNEIPDVDTDVIAAPTHQMACDWLRKTYNIHIGINPISGKGYNATIYDVADFDDYGIIYSTESFFHVEEAYEVALKYSLENLVKL